MFTSSFSPHVVPLATLIALGGCSLFSGSKSQEPTGQRSAAAAPVIPDESKNAIREQEKQTFAAKGFDSLEQPEKDIKKALELSLGRVAPYQGGQKPYPASESITALRKAKIKLYLEPVTDQDGKVVGNNFVQLKDAYTDRVQQLSRKLAEQKASKREIAEIQKGSKYIVKLTDVKQQVTAFSLPAMQSGWYVTNASLTTMLATSHMVRTRRTYEMQWIEEDYEIIRLKLIEQRRAESLAAISIGMLAAYQAVLDGADPKALDAIAEESLKAFPLKPEATTREAKDYVENLGNNIGATKERYETQMRKAYGDKLYEQNFKMGIDGMFDQAEKSMSAKSAGQIAADANQKYQEDLEKCRRGEPIDPGSLAGGPTCDRAREEALKGGGAKRGGASAKGAAEAVASGDAGKMLDSAQQMLPADGPIGHSLAGVQAIRNKDPRGAIKAALNLVPAPGPVKAGLSLASKLLDVVPRVKGRRRKRA